MWSDSNNILYAGNNNGDIYIIENPTSSSPSATFLISTTATNQNDGISCPDANPFEEVLDTDNDGITNDLDRDDDNDGILDTDEGDGTTDTDSDGTPDSLDLDADDDGCDDVLEAGFTDADADGEVDGTGVDADGLVTDSDGYIAPLDGDNSGTSDHLEYGIADACTSFPDSDGDGVDDNLDLDDDNDGIFDTDEDCYGGLDLDIGSSSGIISGSPYDILTEGNIAPNRWINALSRTKTVRQWSSHQ